MIWNSRNTQAYIQNIYIEKEKKKKEESQKNYTLNIFRTKMQLNRYHIKHFFNILTQENKMIGPKKDEIAVNTFSEL